MSAAPHVQRASECRRCTTPIEQEQVAGRWVPPLCASCLGENEREQARRAHSKEIDDRRRLFDRSKLPAEFVSGKRTLQQVIADARDRAVSGIEPAVAAIQSLLNPAEAYRLRPWLYVSGPVGSFKTSLAAAALAYEIERGRPGRYVSFSMALSQIRATFRDDATDSEAAFIARLQNTPRLVIDDVGAEKPSPHTVDVLTRVLDARSHADLESPRWLIITSNFPLAQLGSRLASAATASVDVERPLRRIAERSLAVNLGGAA